MHCAEMKGISASRECCMVRQLRLDVGKRKEEEKQTKTKTKRCIPGKHSKRFLLTVTEVESTVSMPTAPFPQSALHHGYGFPPQYLFIYLLYRKNARNWANGGQCSGTLTRQGEGKRRKIWEAETHTYTCTHTHTLRFNIVAVYHCRPALFHPPIIFLIMNSAAPHPPLALAPGPDI